MTTNFMIIGAQKCGTSTLFDILKTHPRLQESDPKEPHYFSTNKKPLVNLDEYHKIFKEGDDDTLYYEASTSYSFYPIRRHEIYSDIKAYNPKMKFIYLVRDPSERVISHYMHLYERGYTDKTLSDSIVDNTEGIVTNTKYYSQIMPYIDNFTTKNVLILDFQELITKPTIGIEKISQFLSLDPRGFKDIKTVHSNKSLGGNKWHHKYDRIGAGLGIVRRLKPDLFYKITDNSNRKFITKPKLSNEDKAILRFYLLADIKSLEQLLGKDFSSWKHNLT